MLAISLVPRPLEGEGPGTHCSRMLRYPKDLGGLDTIVNYSASLIRIPVRDNNVYLPFELYLIYIYTLFGQRSILINHFKWKGRTDWLICDIT